MKLILGILTITFALLVPLASWAQETTNPLEKQNERVAGAGGFKDLSAEEREARRAEMRGRFESLSDEQRAEIKQRRQARLQNHEREHRMIRQAKRRNNQGSTGSTSAEVSPSPN